MVYDGRVPIKPTAPTAPAEATEPRPRRTGPPVGASAARVPWSARQFRRRRATCARCADRRTRAATGETRGRPGARASTPPPASAANHAPSPRSFSRSREACTRRPARAATRECATGPRPRRRRAPAARTPHDTCSRQARCPAAATLLQPSSTLSAAPRPGTSRGDQERRDGPICHASTPPPHLSRDGALARFAIATNPSWSPRHFYRRRAPCPPRPDQKRRAATRKSGDGPSPRVHAAAAPQPRRTSHAVVATSTARPPRRFSRRRAPCTRPRNSRSDQERRDGPRHRASMPPAAATNRARSPGTLLETAPTRELARAGEAAGAPPCLPPPPRGSRTSFTRLPRTQSGAAH